MKKALPILLLFSACFLFEDENQNTNLTLSEGAIGVATVRLHVEPEDSLAQFTFELTRDDSTVQTLSLQSDTLIKDTGLNPNTSYTYTGYWMDGTKRIGESNTLTLTTMDTTSHNFTWVIDTLGEYGSFLKDVAIIDENNIWVVGYIVMPDPDSSFNGTGREMFNAAHWDGNEWELIKIQPQGYVQPLKCIYYFNESDIWFGQSTLPIHWDGANYYLFTPANDNYPGGSIINAIWGSSPNNIYFVGSSGGIIHYDGNEFVEMESGTDINLFDIDGTQDGEHLFIRGFDEYAPSRNIVLEYDGSQWNTIYYTKDNNYPEENGYGHIEGIGVFKDTLYVSTVAGLWKYNFINDSSSLISNNYTQMSRGAFVDIIIVEINDIFILGAAFAYIHYNGISYHHNSEIKDQYTSRGSFACDYKGNLAVMVGFINSFDSALIARGYH